MGRNRRINACCFHVKRESIKLKGTVTCLVIVNISTEHDEMHSTGIEWIVEIAIGTRLIWWNSKSSKIRCKSHPLNLWLNLMIPFNNHHRNLRSQRFHKSTRQKKIRRKQSCDLMRIKWDNAEFNILRNLWLKQVELWRRKMAHKKWLQTLWFSNKTKDPNKKNDVNAWWTV